MPYIGPRVDSERAALIFDPAAIAAGPIVRHARKLECQRAVIDDPAAVVGGTVEDPAISERECAAGVHPNGAAGTRPGVTVDQTERIHCDRGAGVHLKDAARVVAG